MRVLALTAAALLALGGGRAGAANFVARIAPVVDEHYGERLTDNYRWMESVDPEFVAWAHSEDGRTRNELQALPGYPKLLKDITAAVEAQVTVGGVQRVGGRLYYRRRGPGEAQASLYMRPFAGGAETKLLDPVALKGPLTSLGDYAASPDNHYLAYTLADAGSEESTLYILDLKRGRTFPEAIDRTRFASPTWSPDATTLFYNRLKAGGVGPDRFADEAIYRHTPGDAVTHDTPVFTAATVGASLGRAAFLSVEVPAGSAYALAYANSGVSRESEIFVTPVAALKGVPTWRRLATLDDKIESLVVAAGGHTAYLSTFRDAPRRKLLRVDLSHPDLSHATVVAPERSDILTQVASAKDGVYLVYSVGGAFSLRRLDTRGGVRSIALPFKGSIYALTTDARREGAAISLESWIQPRRLLAASTDGSLRDLHLAPAFPMDLSQLTSETIEATAKDGTKIPVDVVHRKDLRLDGSATTLVDAYGAYGEPADPYFQASYIPFLLGGGVYAEAHVRGGGEFGETWHLGGKGVTKPNTWRDFIASVERLEALGYTSPTKVAGMGVSAGGVMIGRTVTERPDLLAAAVMWAPMINTLRFETTEGGPANTAEFGSIATREGYAALREMDAYSHVVDGTRYPAVLLTGGINDHRVPVWMAGEMAARLGQASISGKPVRLRVDFEGGHHLMGAAKADQISQDADTIAFVLQNTGAPTFRPIKSAP